MNDKLNNIPGDGRAERMEGVIRMIREMAGGAFDSHSQHGQDDYLDALIVAAGMTTDELQVLCATVQHREEANEALHFSAAHSKPGPVPLDSKQHAHLDAADLLKVRKAEKLVMENLSSRWTLGMVAEKTGIKKRMLTRLFKIYHGKTLVDFISDACMDKAMTLVCTHKDMSIMQIASAIGYTNLSAFTRAFKKKFRKPPTKWRKRG